LCSYSHEASHSTTDIPSDHLLHPTPEELKRAIVRELIARKDVAGLVREHLSISIISSSEKHRKPHKTKGICADT